MATLQDFVVSPALNDFKVPELPNLQELTKARGYQAGLTEFGLLLRQWKVDFERVLVDRLRLMSLPEPDSTEEVAAVSEASASLAEIAALTSQVQQAVNGLASHIAATAAHGTTSAVTGIADEQALERKAIGLNYPRHLRVLGFSSTNLIQASESYTVNTGDNWVVAGPFTVTGLLTVNGHMRFL